MSDAATWTVGRYALSTRGVNGARTTAADATAVTTAGSMDRDAA